MPRRHLFPRFPSASHGSNRKAVVRRPCGLLLAGSKDKSVPQITAGVSDISEKRRLRNEARPTGIAKDVPETRSTVPSRQAPHAHAEGVAGLAGVRAFRLFAQFSTAKHHSILHWRMSTGKERRGAQFHSRTRLRTQQQRADYVVLLPAHFRSQMNRPSSLLT